MLVFPQLIHFPVVKRRNARTVLNRMSDGRSVRLADPAGEVTEWRLQFTELSDDEAQTLEQFFAAAEGTLNSWSLDLRIAFYLPDRQLSRWWRLEQSRRRWRHRA